MKFKNIMFSLPLIAFSMSANAEIKLDAQDNVSYAGLKNAALAITADGSASVNGTVLKQCQAGDAGKTFKAKLGSVECEDTYVVLKDKNGNTLSRFSSYALATDNKGTNERQLFDPSLATLGSPTTGASVLNQTQSTTVEQTKTETVQTMAAPPGYLNKPAVTAPKIDQTTYTPKLGVMAERTPAVNNTRTPEERQLDKTVATAEIKARTSPPGSTVAVQGISNTPVIVNTQTSPAVVETKTVTSVIQPTPDNAKDGAKPQTTTQTQTTTIPMDNNAASAVIAIPGAQ